MFFLTYLGRELRRRTRQALLTAAGLAAGIGLVVTVIAAATGVAGAQTAALHSLYGIGTDVTVTMASLPAATGPAPDVLSAGALGLMDSSWVTSIARLHGVTKAAGGLLLTALQPPPGAVPASVEVDGVEVTHLGLGPIASTTVGSGRGFTAADTASDVALVDAGYAAANSLRPGSTIAIAGTTFQVVGIVRQPRGGGSADVYIPLGRAQSLGQQQYHGSTNLAGKVNTIYVAAAGATDVPAVQAEISRLLPSATVTSSASLASAVSGSLASAARLIDELGRWLSVAVLAAAFAVSSLLTMGAVGRRVRELGTLKALGWSGRRIVLQIMGESFVVGLAGAVMGIALGFVGAALVTLASPRLTATVATNPGSTPEQAVTLNGSGQHQSVLPGATHTIDVHLVATVTVTAVVLAVVLAIAGSLIAGSLGAWRAARLRPAEALAQVE